MQDCAHLMLGQASLLSITEFSVKLSCKYVNTRSR